MLVFDKEVSFLAKISTTIILESNDIPMAVPASSLH